MGGPTPEPIFRMLDLALSVALLLAPAQETATAPVERAPLDRVVVLGASVSAGAGTAAELEVRRDVGLGTFLAATYAAVPEEPPAPKDLGSSYFFMDPRANGAKQIAGAREAEATVVVALDFLFWYAFGEKTRRDPRRARGLEDGLRALEKLECPIVLGDLPNIEHALTGVGPFGGPLVHRGMFPTERERRAMNERIAAWAKERGRVAIVPLSDLLAHMKDGGTTELRGSSWTIDEIGDALQKDRLHPTVLGTSWVTLHIADALIELELATPERFRWDGTAVAARARELTEPERARKREFDARKAARRKAREERQKRASGDGG